MAYEPKTKKSDASVEEFIAAVEPKAKRDDSLTLLKLMREVTGDEGALWGPNIIGFGKYIYKYASGTSGEWPVTGFSPRKRSFSIYITSSFDRYEELLSKLGKHKIGGSCLYVNKLSDVDLDVLRELVGESVIAMREIHPA